MVCSSELNTLSESTEEEDDIPGDQIDQSNGLFWPYKFWGYLLRFFLIDWDNLSSIYNHVKFYSFFSFHKKASECRSKEINPGF